VIAILGGLGAALAWATSGLCSSRSSRMLGSPSVVAWIALVGLVVTGPAVLADGVPAHMTASDVGWLALAGGGNVAGLLVAYVAFRAGDVSLISPIISTEGAVAAVIAFAAGERVGLATAFTLFAIAAGIVLAASAPRHHDREPHLRRVVLPAGIAAGFFGVSLYATGHVSGRLPLAWVVLPPRLIGALVVAVPLALSGRLRLTRRTAPLVIASGLCEVLGFASYSIGARHDIAVAAILSCQFAAISAVVAYFLFRERLGRPQLAGVIVVLIGVSALSGLRA
jgi:drug/metabolite transporter (DMT)-like permease